MSVLQDSYLGTWLLYTFGMVNYELDKYKTFQIAKNQKRKTESKATFYGITDYWVA